MQRGIGPDISVVSLIERVERRVKVCRRRLHSQTARKDEEANGQGLVPAKDQLRRLGADVAAFDNTGLRY